MVAPGIIGGDIGRVTIDSVSRLPKSVKISNQLTPAQASNVLAHEIGHVIHQQGGEFSLPDKLLGQAKHIYNEGNNADLAAARARGYDIEKNPRPVYRGVTPESKGYRKSESVFELIAEGIRAYTSNPDYIKTVAPEFAAYLRKTVKSHPKLREMVQLNTIAPIAIGGGALLFGNSRAEASELPADRLARRMTPQNAAAMQQMARAGKGMSPEELAWLRGMYLRPPR